MNEFHRIDRRGMRSLPLLSVVAVVALGGCGEHTGSAVGRVDDVGRSASVATTIPAVTSSERRTDDASMFATPTTVTMPTVEPDDSVDQQLLEIEFRSLLDRRLACVRSPRQCDPSDFAAEGSSLHDEVSRMLIQRVADGIVATDGGYDVRTVSVARLSDDEVEIATCVVDSVVLTDVSGDAPVLVDDSVRGERSVWTMRVTPSGWRLGSKEVERWSMDDSVCAG